MNDKKVQVLTFCLLVSLLAIFLLYKRQATCSIEEKVPTTEEIKQQNGIFSLPHKQDEPIHVGFLGESQTVENSQEGFDPIAMQHLYEVLKKHNAQAVFFMGNAVSGENASGARDPKIFAKQLGTFYQLSTKILGTTPLFPALGNHDVAFPEGSVLFRRLFHLEGSIPFEDGAFGYGVSIGQAFFAVISTSVYDEQNHVVKSTFSSTMLIWLNYVLQQAAANHKYLFVVGNHPAYTSTTVLSENQSKERDDFWEILVENKVLAYFSSHEHLFDRSNRRGVWQIISGGAGSPFENRKNENTFVHCVLMDIPSGEQGVPHVEVFDENGEVADKFDLSPNKSLLYQLHISG